MKTVIFLPTQAPHLPRRGPEAKSDWWVQCRLAAERHRREPDSVIYVPSAFRQAGSKSELELYGERLQSEGVPMEAVRLDPSGLETVEQCELAQAFAARESARLVAITCQVQSRRVRYLLPEPGAEHLVARGTPNGWMRLTHILLGLGFPVIDALGLRSWWKQRVARRRLAGSQ